MKPYKGEGSFIVVYIHSCFSWQIYFLHYGHKYAGAGLNSTGYSELRINRWIDVEFASHEEYRPALTSFVLL
jgi:hypothetical protein